MLFVNFEKFSFFQLYEEHGCGTCLFWQIFKTTVLFKAKVLLFITVENKMKWKKDFKYHCPLKMCMYLFENFNVSKDSHHIATILTCSDTNDVILSKTLVFKKRKKFLHSLHLSFIYSEIFHKSKKPTFSRSKRIEMFVNFAICSYLT